MCRRQEWRLAFEEWSCHGEAVCVHNSLTYHSMQLALSALQLCCKLLV